MANPRRRPATNDAIELYATRLGRAVVSPSEDYLPALEEESVDLVVTSPPFALLRQKAYGNHDQDAYVDWLTAFGPLVRRVLKPTGSFVLDLGGAYQRGVPVRSLYNFRVLLKLCDDCGFHLAEEFFWHNPAKLPSPIEWVNKRKIRAKDSVNTIWWMSKSEFPKADITKVLVPYSDRMKKLIADPKRFYRAKDRPSGHDISEGFGKDNGGALPSNLLQFPNTESNSAHIRLCKEHGYSPHPARFPKTLPSFFIKMLTDPGDVVVDIFGGSNTTGEAAEQLGRRWIYVESDRDYAIASAFRFMGDWEPSDVKRYLKDAKSGNSPISIDDRRLASHLF
jgi:site-specific DNA-methyltransferase (cytosine-N4-specific)